MNVCLRGIVVECQTGDREVPSSNPTHDKFLKYVNHPLKMSGGVKPHRNRFNNNNNSNNNNGNKNKKNKKNKLK